MLKIADKGGQPRARAGFGMGSKPVEAGIFGDSAGIGGQICWCWACLVRLAEAIVIYSLL